MYNRLRGIKKDWHVLEVFFKINSLMIIKIQYRLFLFNNKRNYNLSTFGCILYLSYLWNYKKKYLYFFYALFWLEFSAIDKCCTMSYFLIYSGAHILHWLFCVCLHIYTATQLSYHFPLKKYVCCYIKFYEHINDILTLLNSS